MGIHNLMQQNGGHWELETNFGRIIQQNLGFVVGFVADLTIKHGGFHRTRIRMGDWLNKLHFVNLNMYLVCGIEQKTHCDFD